MKKIITVLLVLTTMQIMAQEKMQPMVSVNGEGTVKVVPDEVIIRVSSEVQGKKAPEVKAENDKVIDAVLKFLKQSGIPDKDVQTQYVQLHKNYDYNTKTYNYNATQSITILLKDIKAYEKTIAGLMESGINRIDGITFGTSKLEELKSEARKNAIAHAKKKAVEYAQSLNQTIGKAVLITETGSYNPPVPMYRNMVMTQAKEDFSSVDTLSPGEMEVKAEIQVSFELL